MENIVRKDRIKSFDGLKFITMLLIFYWHSCLPRPDFDLGARCCEFFFVVSGFSVGYNYYGTEFPASLKDGLQYFLKKLVSIWPLHIFCLFLDLLFSLSIPSNFQNLKTLFLNFFLLQSWSNDENILFSYNGVSWFLSSLIFCYLFAPILLKTIRTLKNSILLFTLVSSIRLIWEYFSNKGILNCNISFHTFPPVRLLEFYLGMLIVPLFFKVLKYINNKMTFSIIEITTIFCICLLIVYYNDSLRGVFVIAFCILTFVFAFQKGVISKILSLDPFDKFSKIQIEFFLLHQELIYFTYALAESFFRKKVFIFFFQFAITILCSVLLDSLFKKVSLRTKIIEKINKI